jgi:hypothetical protein
MASTGEPFERGGLMSFHSLLTRLIEQQRQQSMIEDEIRRADTSRLEPGLSETDLIQQLVSHHSSKISPTNL